MGKFDVGWDGAAAGGGQGDAHRRGGAKMVPTGQAVAPQSLGIDFVRTRQLQKREHFGAFDDGDIDALSLQRGDDDAFGATSDLADDAQAAFHATQIVE